MNLREKISTEFEKIASSEVASFEKTAADGWDLSGMYDKVKSYFQQNPRALDALIGGGAGALGGGGLGYLLGGDWQSALLGGLGGGSIGAGLGHQYGNNIMGMTPYTTAPITNPPEGGATLPITANPPEGGATLPITANPPEGGAYIGIRR